VQDYASLCRPGLLEEDPSLFYGFWGHCYNRYRASAPHSGYSILRRWCTDVLPLPTGTAASNHWVYSSNVDGHFRRIGFEHNCLLELHGNCAEHPGWFCPACSSGNSGEGESTGLSGSASPPDGYEFMIDPETMTLPDMPSGSGDGAAAAHGFGEGWPRCAGSKCNSMLRPAAHMFAEDSAALLSWLRNEEGRYVEWECAMENDIVESMAASRDCAAIDSSTNEAVLDTKTGTRVVAARSTRKLVLLEIGCGLTVPTVRMEMECVLRDVTERIAPDSVWKCETCDGVNLGKGSALACYKCGAPSVDDSTTDAEISAASRSTSNNAEHKRHEDTAGALLVRINPQFPQNPGWEGRTIEIRAGAREALENINAVLLALGR